MRIVWLAAADARGHLMRAHLMRGLLRQRGVQVDVVTTARQGVAFLEALGTPSRLLSAHYGVAFDAWQNMDRRRTEQCVLSYLLKPSRALGDAHRLHELCRHGDLLVNDFHPLLLLAGAAGIEGAAPQPPTVHVYGQNLWRAIEHNFEGRGPAFLDRRFAALMRALRDRAYARVEHTFDERASQRAPGRTFRLPPILAAPARPAAEVRAHLGVRPDQRLAAVYLNPHFADAALADLLEAALRERGYLLHAVGEGFAARRGWLPYDPRFADVAASADLLVSAPGMGAVAAAKLFQRPFLALLTDQPEQRDNCGFLGGGRGARFAAVALTGPRDRMHQRLRAEIAAFAADPAPAGALDARAAAQAVHARWVQVFVELLAHTARGARSRPSIQPEVHP